MYAAKLVIVLLIVLAVVVATPQAREQVGKAWENVKPAVAEITDHLYVAIRDLMTQPPSQDRIDETPEPGPGGDFLRIVTMNSSFAL